MRFRDLPVCLVAAALLFAACGGGEEGGGAGESETTVSTFGQFADRADLPTVVYDGEACTYIGPETVAPGPVRMTLDNRSDTRARIDILRFPEGRTFEDLVAYVDSGEAAANQGQPHPVRQHLRHSLLHRRSGTLRDPGGRHLRSVGGIAGRPPSGQRITPQAYGRTVNAFLRWGP